MVKNKNIKQGEKMTKEKIHAKCKCYDCNKKLQKEFKNFSEWLYQLKDPLDALCKDTFDYQLAVLKRKYKVVGTFIPNIPATIRLNEQLKENQ